jgi:hypothetical protein
MDNFSIIIFGFFLVCTFYLGTDLLEFIQFVWKENKLIFISILLFVITFLIWKFHFLLDLSILLNRLNW